MSKQNFNQISLVIFVGILIVAATIAQRLSTNPDMGAFIGLFLMISAIPLLIGFIIYLGVRNSACPSCEWVLKRQEVTKEPISERKGYETITRESRDKEGNVTGRWQDQIRVKKIEFQHNYKCTHCGHEWTGISVKKTDTFDD